MAVSSRPYPEFRGCDFRSRPSHSLGRRRSRPWDGSSVIAAQDTVWRTPSDASDRPRAMRTPLRAGGSEGSRCAAGARVGWNLVVFAARTGMWCIAGRSERLNARRLRLRDPLACCDTCRCKGNHDAMVASDVGLPSRWVEPAARRSCHGRPGMRRVKMTTRRTT